MRDPAGEKILSYIRDRRNDWGNSKHASRKGVPWRKAWVNRTFRRAVEQAIDESDTEGTDDRIDGIRRNDWRKCPDVPLATWVDRPTKAHPGGSAGGSSRCGLRTQAQRRLVKKRGW